MRVQPKRKSQPHPVAHPQVETGLGLGLDALRWAAILVPIAAGALCRALGLGIAALWLFVAAAVVAALVLPLAYALVSPLFVGVAAWLVDMLPLVVLVGWAAALARWGLQLLRERRLPRGGRWIWLPIGLVAWTTLGALVITGEDLKHFVLLLAIQVLISGTLLVAVDRFDERDRRRAVVGVLAFVLLLSVGVLLEWVGAPIQELQDETVSARAEKAYGVNAFPNNVGMIKYARAQNGGAHELRSSLDALARDDAGLPSFVVSRPNFKAYGTDLLVVFSGSARSFEDQLRARHVELIYDNVGLAPGRSVPRLRSFPRNALTYAGVCAAAFPLGFAWAWNGRRKARILGWLAVAACVFGAGFALARGAWVAILIGVVYLMVDGVLNRRRKTQIAAAFVAGAVVLTGVFLVKYGENPVTARAGGEGSVSTRQELYDETLRESVGGLQLLVGFGTEQPRLGGGASHIGSRYVPRAGTHSTYLNYLFRTGVPGVLAIMALYGLAALHARAAARAGPASDRLMATLLTAAVFVAAAHAVILSLYVEPVYTLVISLILGVAMATAVGLPTSTLPWRTTQTS